MSAFRFVLASISLVVALHFLLLLVFPFIFLLFLFLSFFWGLLLLVHAVLGYLLLLTIIRAGLPRAESLHARRWNIMIGTVGIGASDEILLGVVVVCSAASAHLIVWRIAVVWVAWCQELLQDLLVLRYAVWGSLGSDLLRRRRQGWSVWRITLIARAGVWLDLRVVVEIGLCSAGELLSLASCVFRFLLMIEIVLIWIYPSSIVHLLGICAIFWLIMTNRTGIVECPLVSLINGQKRIGILGFISV